MSLTEHEKPIIPPLLFCFAIAALLLWLMFK
jgi:hypothetical protein